MTKRTTIRPFGMDAKIVDVGNDSVIIHAALPPIRRETAVMYSKVYQNEGTQEIDRRFGLIGEPVKMFSDLENAIRYSMEKGGFGDFATRRVLVGFGALALRGGRFIGIPEDEFRAYADDKDNLPSFDHSSRTIDSALEYNAGLAQPYLRRINVEGTRVIFPANIAKLG